MWPRQWPITLHLPYTHNKAMVRLSKITTFQTIKYKHLTVRSPGLQLIPLQGSLDLTQMCSVGNPAIWYHGYWMFIGPVVHHFKSLWYKQCKMLISGSGFCRWPQMAADIKNLTFQKYWLERKILLLSTCPISVNPIARFVYLWMLNAKCITFSKPALRLTYDALVV